MQSAKSQLDVGTTTDFDVKEQLGVRLGDPIVPVSPFTIVNYPRLMKLDSKIRESSGVTRLRVYDKPLKR